MNGPEDEYPLIRQYRDWIQSSPSEDSPDREQFFTQGTVVLDTNVLLSLYEYLLPPANRCWRPSGACSTGCGCHTRSGLSLSRTAIASSSAGRRPWKMLPGLFRRSSEKHERQLWMPGSWSRTS